MSVTVNDDQFLWVEKFRPARIDECILPERIKSLALKQIESGEITNMLFFGSGGTGKTTLAKAIAAELDCDVLVINCSNENGIDTIRTKLTQFATSVSLDGKPKIAVLDEADGITPAAQSSLRNFIEAYSKNCRFIFTCNFKNKLIAPLHSRLVPIDFTLSKDEKAKVVVQFFKRVCEILALEGVEFEKPILAKIIERHFPDFRRTLGELQRYSLERGGIDAGVLTSVKNVEMGDLIDALKTKNFNKMRAWVTNNIDNDPNMILRRLYDMLDEHCVVTCIPNMILIIAEYQRNAAFVSDHEINLVACLIEMMSNCEWR